MTAREWKPGDRALLPVTISSTGSDGVVEISRGSHRTLWVTLESDLIPDDRPVTPEWWPPHEGDVVISHGRGYERGQFSGTWYRCGVSTGLTDSEMTNADLIVRDGKRYPQVTP